MIKVGDIVHKAGEKEGEDYLVTRTYETTKHLSRYGGTGRLKRGTCMALPLENGEVMSTLSHYLPEKKLTKVGHFDGDIIEVLHGRIKSIFDKPVEEEPVVEKEPAADNSNVDFWDLFDA